MNYPHRRILRSRISPRPGRTAGHKGDWGPPKTWQQVQAVTKFLKGKKFKGKDVFGFLDQPKPWGGFLLLLPRAAAPRPTPNIRAKRTGCSTRT